MSKDYVTNDSLRLELIKSHNEGKLTSSALEMLILMVDRIQRQFKYDDTQDKEDCRSSAIEVVLRNWQTCELTRPRPFAYFTRMIYNGLYAGWNTLAKSRADFSISNIFNESI